MGDDKGRRYAAFLSYSHKDAADARWLHRRLESYRLPRRLAGSEGEHGPVPARLTPVFRDREDLRASGSLSESVRAALAASDNLIVICSPDSAASDWVAKEIALFRELHPGRPVFAAIVDGDPAQCFPPNLPPADGAEPLAADLRPHRDGRRLGFLKLVAGLAGVPLDALVQRDAQRRIRRVMAVTAAAVAAMLAMAVMTTLALNARREAQHQRAEAERQRAEAEGLVEFMLTDLRDRLKDAAGLKVRAAVNGRALAYYQRQDIRSLSTQQLEQLAQLQHVLGDDDIDRGDLSRAVQWFRLAASTTSRLLRESPDDPRRIYTHAQSEFWLGDIDLRRHNFARARSAFQRYKALAERLIAMSPDDRKWQAEVAFAEGNLCTVEVDSRGDLRLALKYCSASLRDMRKAARGSGDLTMAKNVLNRQGWLADVYRDLGDRKAARTIRRAQTQALERLGADHFGIFDLNEIWVTNQTSVAELEIADGEISVGRQRLEQTLIMANQLTRADPTSAVFARRKRRIEDDVRLVNSTGTFATNFHK